MEQTKGIEMSNVLFWIIDFIIFFILYFLLKIHWGIAFFASTAITYLLFWMYEWFTYKG